MKLSLEEVKKISPKALLRLINIAIEKLKSDQIIKDLFKKYSIEISLIDIIPIYFSDLDVSAQTRSGIIYLNYKLLCDGDFGKDYSYLIHEISHWAQQISSIDPLKSSSKNYLQDKNEQEGFENQVKYIDKNYGKNEAQKYINDLLDYHDLDGSLREEIKSKLEDKI